MAEISHIWISPITIPRTILDRLNLPEIDHNKLILQINTDRITQSGITLEQIQHAIAWGNKLDAATQAKWNANPWLGSSLNLHKHVSSRCLVHLVRERRHMERRQRQYVADPRDVFSVRRYPRTLPGTRCCEVCYWFPAFR
jgi:hypothetical protein